MAVVKAGGKQYLVRENDEIVVDNLSLNPKDTLSLETLAVFDEAGTAVQVGSPILKTQTKAEVLENGKGDKIRVARFKAKVRYRKVRGFRSQLTKIKILSI